MTHDIGLLYLSELHVLTRSVHFISHNSTVLVFTATAFRLASELGTVLSCLSIFMGYTYRENVEVITLTWLRMIMYPRTSSMGDHGKRHESEAGPDLRSFLKYKSCNSSHCKNCKYILLLQMSNYRV